MNEMNDHINRQAAIDALTEYGNGRTVYIGVEEAIRRIEQLPPAQPENIRCKDCKYNTYSKKCLHPDSFFLVPADDFYCGYAERRTDE